MRDLNADFTLNNCSFRTVKLTKNAHPDKYKYIGYGLEFDSLSEFSFTDKSMIILRAYMSSSVHIDNKNKDILIFGEGPTQGLDDIMLKPEAIYSINFTQSNKRFTSNNAIK